MGTNTHPHSHNDGQPASLGITAAFCSTISGRLRGCGLMHAPTACSRRVLSLGCYAVFAAVLILGTLFIYGTQASDRVLTVALEARVIAVGIPGVAGIRQVGHFHAGGAIPSTRRFAAATRPGHILAPERLLVASTSNFSAPLGVLSQAAGSILSIDPTGHTPLLIPADFGLPGGQATALNGQVRIFTSQSPAFLNRVENPGALTALYPAVSSPRYISINNAFGRPWFANAPEDSAGFGTSTVIDPTGRPLANPPSMVAGGVFAGSETNRRAQLAPGALTRGAVGTAFLGASPDASGFAVFAVVETDGSIVQVHVRDGIDGLAPPGTVTPLQSTALERNRRDGARLVGMAFNWTPDRIIYLTDGPQNAVVALHLKDDGHIFRVHDIRRYTAPQLAGPIDLVPALPEVANPRFSSHTTLAGGSDLYVANRQDGTVVRMTQAGGVLAQAHIKVPGLGVLGANRISGIAVSADAQRLWLTLNGELPDYPGYEGVLIEVSAFNARGPFHARHSDLIPAGTHDTSLAEKGRVLFMTEFTPEQGLGPLFNKRSCVACHGTPTPGGMGSDESTLGRRIGHLEASTGRFDILLSAGGPVAHRHSIRELGYETALRPGIPPDANVVSLRMPPGLYGLGLIDQIPDEVILSQAINKGDGIHGRPNMVMGRDGKRRVGKFGWKADLATLEEMIAVAFASELGITSPLAPHAMRIVSVDNTVGDERVSVENDGGFIAAVKAFIASLPWPSSQRKAE